MRKGRIIGFVCIIIGAAVAVSPLVIQLIYQNNFSHIITDYIAGIDGDSSGDFAKADEYNRLISNGEGTDVNYYDALSFGDEGMIGYISVPKVNIELPIYHGTSDSVLAKGVGHMKNTSLPVGGKSTHAVLVGHTGLSYEMFDRLSELVKGDKFTINVQNRRLTYKVDRIVKCLPSDTKYTEIIPAKDYVTLVTCVSDGGLNARRLLVRGERILNEGG